MKKLTMSHIFSSVENDTMYIYMTFASDDVEVSNKIAWNSKKETDIKHFEYMKACIDRENSLIIPAALQFNTL